MSLTSEQIRRAEVSGALDAEDHFAEFGTIVEPPAFQPSMVVSCEEEHAVYRAAWSRRMAAFNADGVGKKARLDEE